MQQGKNMQNLRSNDPILFFSKREKTAIEASIMSAESRTSAEIRIHLERVADSDILSHAQRVFEKLGMTRTKNRNAVLIFIGVKSRRFAIIGDEGIHSKVHADYWKNLAEEMTVFFKKNAFSEGLELGINSIAAELAKYFPHEPNDVNELSNEISFSA